MIGSTDPEVTGLSVEVDERTDSLTICHPVGDLDAYSVSRFRHTLADHASAPRLLIDLSDVPFIDSAGLGALIGGIRGVREHGGEVALASSRPATRRLLRTSGLDRIVTVTRTAEEAAEALAGGRGKDANRVPPAP